MNIMGVYENIKLIILRNILICFAIHTNHTMNILCRPILKIIIWQSNNNS